MSRSVSQGTEVHRYYEGLFQEEHEAARASFKDPILRKVAAILNHASMRRDSE